MMGREQLTTSASSTSNTTLASVIAELGWSLAQLANQINDILGSRYVSRSTVSEWVNHSRVPHDPLPTVVAHLFSDALGRTVTVEELWQGRGKRSPLWLPSNNGIEDVPWGYGGTLELLSDWLRNGDRPMNLDKRTFLAISGTALTSPAWAYVDHLGSTRALTHATESRTPKKITHAMVDVIKTTISHLRRLDDHEGGDLDNLQFVHQHFLSVGEYIKTGEAADASVRKRLLGCWAQLGQLLGWMAHDAELDGLAQRYYRTALQAAHSAEDHALAAHILGGMTYQAVNRGHAKDAIELANAAYEVAQLAGPTMQALIALRCALAQAAYGNAYGFRTAADEAQRLANGATDERPPWLYWFDAKECDAQNGYSLIMLAGASSRNPRNVLGEADDLITPRVTPDNTGRPREALYEGVWLARSFVWRDDIDQAITMGHMALDWLPTVRPPRSITQLRRLDNELENHRSSRNKPEVLALRKRMRAALAA